MMFWVLSILIAVLVFFFWSEVADLQRQIRELQSRVHDLEHPDAKERRTQTLAKAGTRLTSRPE